MILVLRLFNVIIITVWGGWNSSKLTEIKKSLSVSNEHVLLALMLL